MPTVSADDLHTAYQIDAGRGFPCPPVSVSDDGNRMFIRFPVGGAGCRERFPLFAEGEDGDLQLINYSVYDGHLYVTSGVPTRAVILYQTERGRQRRVEIIRKEASGERPRGRRR
jgi:type IV secretory pathway VirB9-like protein